MNKKITSTVVSAIRALYASDENARALFDKLAQRQRDAGKTTIDQLSDKLSISRGESVALARSLEQAECGEFIVGRRGAPSRFRWDYSCISLGKAAAGETGELDAVDENAREIDDDDEIESANGAAESSHAPIRLTIADAKLGLANYFGVPIANIEIKIVG
jgi:hypothetical protein